MIKWKTSAFISGCFLCKTSRIKGTKAEIVPLKQIMLYAKIK